MPLPQQGVPNTAAHPLTTRNTDSVSSRHAVTPLTDGGLDSEVPTQNQRSVEVLAEKALQDQPPQFYTSFTSSAAIPSLLQNFVQTPFVFQKNKLI